MYGLCVHVHVGHLIIAFIFILSFVGRKLKDLRKKYQDKLALASSTAEESISNIRTVRAFTNELKLMSSYNEDIDRSYSLGKVISFLIGGFSGVVFILIYVSELFI